MKVGFIFDTVLLTKDNDYYGLTLNYDFFKKRYLHKFNDILVITRVEKYQNYVGNKEGYRKTNGNHVYVDPIFKYKKIPDAILKKREIKFELQQKIRKCDRIIIRMPSVLGILASEICQKCQVPYMIEMVACPWDSYFNHTNKFGKVIAPFMYYYTKKVIRESDFVLYVTNKFLQKRYPSYGKQFSCSDVELPENSNSILTKRLNNMNNFDSCCFTLCTVGNVGMKLKGHIYVLKAMRQLKKKNIQIKYYLVGNGNQGYLKQQIKKYQLEDAVIFSGSISHEEVFRLLDQIDIYVQPSLTEGLPRALIEAMSRGCCCVASNVGGIPELLSFEYIFKKKSAKQLAQILSGLNKEKISENCVLNYNKAKEYNKNVLDEKRNRMFEKFIGKGKNWRESK